MAKGQAPRFQAGRMTTVGFAQHEPRIGTLHHLVVTDDEDINVGTVKSIDVYRYEGQKEVKYIHNKTKDPFYIFTWKKLPSVGSWTEYKRKYKS